MNQWGLQSTVPEKEQMVGRRMSDYSDCAPEGNISTTVLFLQFSDQIYRAKRLSYESVTF